MDMEERERRFLVQLPTQEIEWKLVPLPGCHYKSTQKVEQFLGEISVQCIRKYLRTLWGLHGIFLLG